MEVKTNLKPPPVIIFQQRLAGVVFLPFTIGGKKPSPAHLWMNVTLLNNRGFRRVADITNNDYKPMPWSVRLQSGQIGTVFARLWGSDMRCKNRAKRVLANECFIVVIMCYIDLRKYQLSYISLLFKKQIQFLADSFIIR